MGIIPNMTLRPISIHCFLLTLINAFIGYWNDANDAFENIDDYTFYTNKRYWEFSSKSGKVIFPLKSSEYFICFHYKNILQFCKKALKWAAFVFISWKFQKKETFSKLFIIIMLAWFCKWTLIDNTFLPCDHPFNLRKIWKILHNTRKRRFEKNTGWNN